MKLAVFAALLVIIPFQTEAASCVGKTVEVWVANGYGIKGDTFKYADPYVKVSIGGDTMKTRILYTTRNPSWWQKFTFRSVPTDTMSIEVWDYDTVTDDDHQGTCMTTLETNNGQFKDVQCTVKENGSVRLFYKCY